MDSLKSDRSPTSQNELTKAQRAFKKQRLRYRTPNIPTAIAIAHSPS
ncbi:hypothetical protein VB711_13115 [Cronbergia sp. UHCC 0137]|nr:hypothetical protein [Cronbergia sp. UHCC 0137]MEA5618771.1 hypothetical protein [Cronbergia sp. UHCC 0137]